MTSAPTTETPAAEVDWMSLAVEQVRDTGVEPPKRRGLCAACALAFEASLPPAPSRPLATLSREHWETEDEFKSTWRDSAARTALYESRVMHRDFKSYRADHTARLQAWPRCEQCPTWTGQWVFQPPAVRDDAPLPPHCNDCGRRARLAVSCEFPNGPYLPGVNLGDPQELWDAYRIAADAGARVHAAWKSAVRRYPRCAKCPNAPAPSAKKGGGPAQDVLLILAGNHEPMNVTQLLEAGIKGLTKNNVAKEMRALEDSGRVISFNKGPSKYFKLP